MKKILGICLILFFFVGCGADTEKKEDKNSQSFLDKFACISGEIVDITPVQESASVQSLNIEFKDGRLVKLRLYYSDVFVFKKRKPNKIYYNSVGCIQGVKVEE